MIGTRAVVGPATARIAIAIVAIAFMAGDASASSGTVARDLLTEANIQLSGAAAGDNAGLSVAGAGDVNGDGVPDLLIGAPQASYAGRSGSGAAYVVFAQPNMASVDLGSLGSDGYVVGGAAAFDDTGVVANAGDVNGDGVPDAVVGAPGAFGGGAAYVVFGKATTAAIDLASLGTNGFRISGGDGRVGAAVAGAGDLNGDSKADVVIGAPDATKPGGCCLNYGAAFVVFGKTDTSAVDLTSLGSGGYRIDGASFGEHAGSAVSSGGDVNGDGLDDVLVSAPNAPYPPAPRQLSGKVYVVFGKATATAIDLASLGAGGYEIDGPSLAAFAGNAVADAGDVNGDGTPDQLIGDQFTNEAYVVFGQSSSLSTIDLAALGTQGYVIDGVDQGFGSSLASLGDVNGDAIPDAVIGAVGASNNGDTSGSAYVLYLHDDASPISLFDLVDGYRLDGGAAHDDAGISVADAGDVNDDGADDPLIGAVFADPSSRAQAGAAYVAFFRPRNDDLADAQDLLGPFGIVDGTTVGATKETGEPDHAGDPGGSSVWYRWTAPASGLVTFSTFGSDFDTVLASYTGSAVNALTEVASNDDADGLPTSEIDFAAVQGTTYSIAIDGAGGGSGPLQLFWILHPPNDDFAAAQLLAGDHGSVNGSSVGATKEPSEPNHAGSAGGASVWYRWTAPATGTLTLDTCESNFDTLLAVYTGADAAHLTAVASNDDGPPACGLGSQVALSVNGGTTYDIAVDGFDGDWGAFVLVWTRTNPPPPPPQPPTNSAVPTITGTPKAGQTLAAARGTWSGTDPIAFGYQWESCDRAGASCVAVPGRTTSTYLVSSSDAGSSLRIVVTASNAAGSASATSAPTAVVPAGPARCVVPNLKGKTVARARRLLRRAHCALGRVSYARSSLGRGLIVSQRPRAHASRPRGTKVRVVVSRGRRH